MTVTDKLAKSKGDLDGVINEYPATIFGISG